MWPSKHSNVTDYYEFILLYTDNVLVISENYEQVLRKDLVGYFELKETFIGTPTIYLGGYIRQVKLENYVRAWALGSSQYVNLNVNNVEAYVSKKSGYWRKLHAKDETPIKKPYRPDIDVSPDLKPSGSAYLQSLIGILCWIVDLGRIDICLEVSMMSSHLVLPLEGHLIHLLQVFSYICKCHNSDLVLDPRDPVINTFLFKHKD